MTGERHALPCCRPSLWVCPAHRGTHRRAASTQQLANICCVGCSGATPPHTPRQPLPPAAAATTPTVTSSALITPQPLWTGTSRHSKVNTSTTKDEGSAHTTLSILTLLTPQFKVRCIYCKLVGDLLKSLLRTELIAGSATPMSVRRR